MWSTPGNSGRDHAVPTKGVSAALRRDLSGAPWRRDIDHASPLGAVIGRTVCHTSRMRSDSRLAFTEMALACVKGGPGTTYTSYWTLDLGRRR